MLPDIGLLEVRFHRPRNRSSNPLVEITKHDPHTFQFVMIHDSSIEQAPRLAPMLEERRSQVDVEDVESRSVESHVGPETTSGKPASALQVVVTARLNGESRQNDVSVLAAVQLAGFTEREVITQLVNDVSEMVAENFLKSNDIGVDFTQDPDDTIGPYLSIQSAALVNVVGNDSQVSKSGGNAFHRPSHTSTGTGFGFSRDSGTHPELQRASPNSGPTVVGVGFQPAAVPRALSQA